MFSKINLIFKINGRRFKMETNPPLSISNGQLLEIDFPSFFTLNPTPSILHSASFNFNFSLTVEVGVWHRRNPSCHHSVWQKLCGTCLPLRLSPPVLYWTEWPITYCEADAQKLGSRDPGSRGTLIKITKVRNIKGDFPHKLQTMYLNLFDQLIYACNLQ